MPRRWQIFCQPHTALHLRQAGRGQDDLARALGRSLPAVVVCEGEWIATLRFEIRSIDDHAPSSRNLAVPDRTRVRARENR
jgi:hypothetical protein